ncbi:MAG: hypothetical protein QOI10_1651 [Solirubrobacterales bacterium]|nr:hypothetical protein [Solirubrobacterales bacterium]
MDDPLTPGDRVEINGSLDLSACIVGPSDACVFSIEMMYVSKVFNEYVINVVAQGPRGALSGTLRLWFYEGPERNTQLRWLDVWSSTKKQHTLPYNSDRPGIVSFGWFTVVL